ncbi:MAG: electron transport complex subunit RsxC [Oscillospiraceae bacterium]|nr:electron transport complex subunit RsxC [Oscillospiraceae bacterium]
MVHSIFGGIHLEGRKEGSRRKPLALPDVCPERVALALRMHAGQACTPLVKVGDKVALGQPVAESEQTVIHASVSGRVAAIEDRPHPWGGVCPAVVIENDGCDTPWQQGFSAENWQDLSESDLVERIAACGIVGMGGAAFPTADKLRAARGRVGTVIVNAAESEPYITADHRLLLERSEAVLTGLCILKKAAGAKHAVAAVEGNKLNAVEGLERTARRKGIDCRVCAVPSRYPLGSEKQVVKAVTGKEIPSEGVAIDVGCVVFNAATAYAVYQAVVEGRALTHRVVTVGGGAVVRPRNLWVPVGTSLNDLIQAAGGLRESEVRVLTGGPMTGRVQTDLNTPILKSTNGVTCLLNWEQGQRKPERDCIRCGRCVAVCPMHLMPILVAKELKLGGDPAELARLHTEDCMACGCCSYICPAHIPLVERMAQARNIVQGEEREV